jgi:hypothetical protein
LQPPAFIFMQVFFSRKCKGPFRFISLKRESFGYKSPKRRWYKERKRIPSVHPSWLAARLSGLVLRPLPIG